MAKDAGGTLPSAIVSAPRQRGASALRQYAGFGPGGFGSQGSRRASHQLPNLGLHGAPIGSGTVADLEGGALSIGLELSAAVPAQGSGGDKQRADAPTGDKQRADAPTGDKQRAVAPTGDNQRADGRGAAADGPLPAVHSPGPTTPDPTAAAAAAAAAPASAAAAAAAAPATDDATAAAEGVEAADTAGGSTRPATAGYPPSPWGGPPHTPSRPGTSSPWPRGDIERPGTSSPWPRGDIERPGTSSPWLRGDIQRPGSSVPRLRELDVEDPALVS